MSINLGLFRMIDLDTFTISTNKSSFSILNVKFYSKSSGFKILTINEDRAIFGITQISLDNGNSIVIDFLFFAIVIDLITK